MTKILFGEKYRRRHNSLFAKHSMSQIFRKQGELFIVLPCKKRMSFRHSDGFNLSDDWMFRPGDIIKVTYCGDICTTFGLVFESKIITKYPRNVDEMEFEVKNKYFYGYALYENRKIMLTRLSNATDKELESVKLTRSEISTYLI